MLMGCAFRAAALRRGRSSCGDPVDLHLHLGDARQLCVKFPNHFLHLGSKADQFATVAA